MALKLMYITNNPDVALVAEKYGVDRIWIDLETLGKAERQKGMDAVLSGHTIDDIKVIAPLLKRASTLVRINPWNDTSCKEVNEVISAGADMLMLPMWKTPAEVKEFISAVSGRAGCILLLETKEAEECLDEVLEIPGIDEIHIGLNDLHLSYGLQFMFELLANGTVERICNRIRKKGIPYGFGGIARLGTGMLKAEKIVLEHYRLGSTGVILSRSFCNTEKVNDIKEIDKIFEDNISKLREFESDIASKADRNTFDRNIIEVKDSVDLILSQINT